MAEKKISFGFKQIKKQPNLLPIKIDNENNKKNDVELIQCLEGQTIKLINEKEEEKLLVIPLKNNQKTSSALASLQNLKQVLNGDEQNEDATASNKKNTNSKMENGSLSLKQRVINELLNDGNDNENDNDSNADKLTLPMAADRLPLDGGEQSTIDDYDKIPITQFGLAMLRGMGLKDEEIKSKQNKEPELRPKGMGLGADKVVKKAKLLVAPAANEILEIKKNAYVRVLGGKFKDLYGQIEGLDDHACRIIVKLALGGNKEAFNEFMVQPVSKKEYQEYGKVINSAKYDEYKRKQEEKEIKKEINTEIKKEFKSESNNIKKERAESCERSDSNAKSNRESNSRFHINDDEYGNSSQRRSRDRSRERPERNSRHNSRDRRDRNRDRSRERNRRSSSYDRNRTKELERNSHKSRYENRRSRSMDKVTSYTSKSRNDRSKDDKHYRRNERTRSPSKSSTFDSNSSDSDDSRHKKRSHQKKSKKKSHKKKSSKKYDSSDDDRHIKKRTKKSKRERSRSTGRR